MFNLVFWLIVSILNMTKDHKWLIALYLINFLGQQHIYGGIISQSKLSDLAGDHLAVFFFFVFFL